MTENRNEEGAGGRGRWVSDQILPRKLKIPILAIKLIKSLYCSTFTPPFSASEADLLSLTSINYPVAENSGRNVKS